jgi:cell division septation protein DedD
MSNPNAPSRTDAVVKLFVVLLVCLFSFAVGTFVGKKFSDEQVKLSKFESASPSQKEKGVAKGENLKTLSDEEVLALAREFMSEESNTRAVASTENDQTSGATDKDQVQITTKPSGGKELPTRLVEEIARQAAGKFTVQIAAYPQEIQAEHEVERLRNDKFNAFYYPTSLVDKKTGESRTWFRVAIGVFDNQAKAEEYRKDLLERAKIQSGFVQKLPRAD